MIEGLKRRLQKAERVRSPSSGLHVIHYRTEDECAAEIGKLRASGVDPDRALVVAIRRFAEPATELAAG
jgi:hypothetical protein